MLLFSSPDALTSSQLDDRHSLFDQSEATSCNDTYRVPSRASINNDQSESTAEIILNDDEHSVACEELRIVSDVPASNEEHIVQAQALYDFDGESRCRRRVSLDHLFLVQAMVSMVASTSMRHRYTWASVWIFWKMIKATGGRVYARSMGPMASCRRRTFGLPVRYRPAHWNASNRAASNYCTFSLSLSLLPFVDSIDISVY